MAKDFEFQNERQCPVHLTMHKEVDCPECVRDHRLLQRDLRTASKALRALEANPAAIEAREAVKAAEARSTGDPDPSMVPEEEPRAIEPGGRAQPHVPLPRVNKVGDYLIYEVRNRAEMYRAIEALPRHNKIVSTIMLGGVVHLIVDDRP